MDYQILHGKAVMLAVSIAISFLLILYFLLVMILNAIEELTGKRRPKNYPKDNHNHEC